MDNCARCGHEIKLRVRIVQSRSYHPSCYENTRKRAVSSELDMWHGFMRYCCKVTAR